MENTQKKQPKKLTTASFLRTLAPYLSQHPLLFSGILFTLIIEIVYALAIPFVYKHIIDDVIFSKDSTLLLLFISIMAVAFLCKAGAAFGGYYLRTRNCIAILNQIRLQLFNKLSCLPINEYHKLNSGEVLASFTHDISNLELPLVRFIPDMLKSLLLIFCSATLLFFLSWKLAVITLFVLIFVALASKFFGTKANEYTHAYKHEEACLSNTIQENTAMQLVVRLFHLQPMYKQRLQQQLELLKQKFSKFLFFTAAMGQTTILTFDLMSLAILGFGGYLVMHDQLTFGILMAFLLLLLNIGNSITSFTKGLPALANAVGSMQRLQRLLTLPEEQQYQSSNKELRVLKQGIHLEEVSFGYTANEPILRQVHLNLPAKQSIGLVGPSGSGKSTLLSLLMRLHQPQQGHIWFDDLQLRKIMEDSLRDRVAVVLQDTSLFNTTIRENIRIGLPGADNAAVEAAAKACHLHETIQNLPNGYDTQVGEGGKNLSGGQRQRVAIARALLKNPDILLLDEITSALDPAAEEAINQTITSIRRGKTVIAVTHRLQSVVDMDRICVMDKGQVVELGTHQELLQQRGLYAELWEKQSGITLTAEGEAQVTVDYLSKIPIFRQIDKAILAELVDFFTLRRYPAHEVVVHEGKPGDSLYLIVRGAVEVTQTQNGHTRTLAKLNDGDYFGEIALLKNIRRTAQVTTRLPSIFLVLQRAQFKKIIAQVPHLQEELEKTAARRQKQNQ